MAIEIERKFLVNNLPPCFDRQHGKAIRQGYLADLQEAFELRIRQKGTRYVQTLKKGEGLARTEIEIELTAEQFERLWPHTAGRRVRKMRYALPIAGGTAELDLFEKELDGLMLVEVEFDSLEESVRFKPPEWFGVEVTEDARYKNKHLAVHGRPRRDG